MFIKLLKGIATYIPGLYKVFARGTGGTISARYCYSVWLRHLTMAYKNGLSTKPNTIAELGPGDSLGIGLSALLSGADRYYAFDIAKYANNERNIKIFEELVKMFREREKIPDETEFPKAKPYLDSYEFPHHILTDERFNNALKPVRIKAIRNAIFDQGRTNECNVKISYFVPWHDSKIIQYESIDMIYSQAVLEHIDDLSYAYEALYKWLKPDGFMSHVIDFKCHGFAREWNGQWKYSDLSWKMIRGARPYLLNRQPLSSHINLMQDLGFEIVCDIKIKTKSGIQRKQLAPRFRYMSDDDLTTSGVFIQAVKKKKT